MAFSAVDKIYSEEIKSIDKRIEECLKEIEHLLKDSSGDTGLKDHLNAQSIDSDVTLLADTEQQEFKFCLQKIVNLIHSNPESTESLFDYIENLRKYGSFPILTSFLNVCECVEEDTVDFDPEIEDEKLFLWYCICFHIKKYIIKQLTQTSFVFSLEESLYKKCKWSLYFKTLLTLYSPVLIREIHKTVRESHLQNFSCACISGNECCLNCLSEFCIQCLIEDVSFLCIGYFQPLVVTWKELQKPYTDKVAEFVSAAIRTLDQWKKKSENTRTLPSSFKCLIEPHTCKNNEFFTKCCVDGTTETVSNDNTSKQNFYPKGSSVSVNSSRRSLRSQQPSKSLGSVVFQNKRRQSLKNILGDYQNRDVNKEENTYTSIVVNLVEELSWFDEQIKCICCVDACSHGNEGFGCAVLNGGPYSLASTSPEESPIHQPEGVVSENYCWDWRAMLVSCGILTSLQHSIQESVHAAVQETLKDIKKGNLETDWTLLMYDSGEPQKIKVLASVIRVMMQVEKFLPIVAASQGPLAPFHASFSHAVHTYLVEVMSQLECIVSSSTDGGNLTVLYIMLNTVLYFQHRVKMFNTLLTKQENEISESYLQGVYQKTSDMVEAVQQRIVAYHLKWLLCSILQDADSHDWKNNKSFYEGMRISFSVQMWQLYMNGARSDLFSILPCAQAQTIMTTLLKDTLQHLCYRYSHASPSESRLPQFHGDIVAILLSTYEMLFSLCQSMNELLGKTEDIRPQTNEKVSQIQNIHNYCTMMLICDCIICSPFNLVYQVYKKGFPSPLSYEMTISPWLPWIQPALFPLGGRGQIMSNVAVWLSAKLCISQPKPDPFLIVQALTIHNSTLSILLLSQTAAVVTEYEAMTKYVDSEKSPPKEEELLELAESVFRVLLHCDHMSDCLTNVLTPLIQRSNDWMEFDSSCLTKLYCKRPWWYKAFQQLLHSFTESIITSVAALILKLSDTKQDITNWPGIQESLSNSLKSRFSKCKEDNNNARCVTEMLSCLADLVPTLPVPLLTCLTSLGSCIPSKSAHPLYDSIGLQVLVSTLYDHLKSADSLKSIFNSEFDAEIFEKCSQIADDLANIVQDLGEAMSSDKTYKKYINQIVQYLAATKKIFQDNWNFLKSEKDYANDSSDTFQDGCLCITADYLLQSESGYEVIHYLYRLLRTNISWIQQSLGIPSLLFTENTASVRIPSSVCESQQMDRTSNNVSDTIELLPRQACSSVLAYTNSLQTVNDCEQLHQLVLKAEHFQTKEYFNPLQAFCHIGDSKLDHESVLKFPISYDSALPKLPDIGMSELNFRTLLSRRWEMCSLAPTLEHQDKFVKVLRTLYGWEERSHPS